MNHIIYNFILNFPLAPTSTICLADTNSMSPSRNYSLCFKNKHLIITRLKGSKKYCYLGFFMYNWVKKKIRFSSINMFKNKLHCFWPILKKNKFINKMYFSLIKLLQRSESLYSSNVMILANSDFLKPRKTRQIWNLFKSRFRVSVARSFFFNMHRRQIQIFWKSQDHFKLNFLKKTRYTTLKFKNKFNYWYKKNKNWDKLPHIRLVSIISKNLLFFSYGRIQKLLDLDFVFKNGLTQLSAQEPVKINDIISVPNNYGSFAATLVLDKFSTLKHFKKKKYEFIKNKLTEWRDLKRKVIKEHNYDFFSSNKIESNIEFDVFSGNIVLLTRPRLGVLNENVTIRHNLEKLNTYKLNV